MSDTKIDCPDPCKPDADELCKPLIKIDDESSTSNIILDVNIKLLTTKLIKNLCDCKEIIDLNEYNAADPDGPISKKLDSLKLIITKKPDPENPTSKCPILKGKVVEGDDIDGRIPGKENGTIDVNPGAGLVINIGKDIKEHIFELQEEVDYNPCCLKESAIGARRVYSLALATSKCAVPLAVSKYLTGWKDFNTTKYDTLTNYEIKGNKYVATVGKLGDIDAVELYVNRDAINLALNSDNSELWSTFPEDHPSKGIAEELPPMGSNVSFNGQTQVAKAYYESILNNYNDLIARLQLVYKDILAGSKSSLKDCYNFTTLLGSGKEHSDTNKEIERATVAVNFVKSPCSYAKKINNSSWDENLCKWIKCLGDEEVGPDGRFNINNLSVKLVKADNTSPSECYEDIPVSATLSGVGNTDIGIKYTLNVEIGDPDSCKETEGVKHCADRYYSVIKQKLEYDFASTNCSTYEPEISCTEYNSDYEFENTEGSIFTVDFFDDKDVFTYIHKETKYGYKGYKCKKCAELTEEINELKKDVSGICCRAGDYDVLNVVDIVNDSGDKTRVPAGSKDSKLEQYSIFDNKSTDIKCCESKGYFWKRSFSNKEYVGLSDTPEKIAETTIQSQCLPVAVCCVPEITDTLGKCYYKKTDNLPQIPFTIEFKVPVYEVKPSDCNDGLEPEQLYKCNLSIALFSKIEGSQTKPVSFELADIAKFLPNMAKRTPGANAPIEKLNTLNEALTYNNIPQLLSILQAMELFSYWREDLRNAKIKYRVRGNNQPITIAVSDFVNKVLIPSTPESLKELYIEPQHCDTLKQAIRLRVTFTKAEQEKSEKLKNCARYETIASGKKTNFGSDPNTYLWMRDKSTKSCSLSKLRDENVSKIIKLSSCGSTENTIFSYRNAAIDPGSAHSSAQNALKNNIESILSSLFKFTPAECVHGTGDGDKFRSACMHKECCEKYCEENGLTYRSNTVSSGEFPGFPIDSDEWTASNRLVPVDNDVDYIPFTTNLKNQLLEDLAKYIYDNKLFKLKLQDTDIAELSIEDYGNSVRKNAIPCKIDSVESQVVSGANIEELKTKCRDLANNAYYNNCSCVDPDLEDLQGVVAECEKDYIINDYRYILVKGTPGSTEVITQKEKSVEIGILFQQFTSGTRTGRFLDGEYPGIRDLADLPETGIEVTYTGPLSGVKKTVTKQQLKGARLIIEELKDIKKLPLEPIKAVLKYNSQGTLSVGKCADSGCIEIQPRPVPFEESRENGTYIPAAHLCIAQPQTFRVFYRYKSSMPSSENLFVKQHNGFGGILKPGVTVCVDGLCDDAVHPESYGPEASEPPVVIDPEQDDPVIPEATDIKPECLDEYNKAVELVNKLKSQIELRLLRFQVAKTQYENTEFNDEVKLRELKIILAENYFGKGTRTISDGTNTGLVIEQHSPVPELTVSKSCENLMDQLDDAGANLAEIRERCKKEE